MHIIHLVLLLYCLTWFLLSMHSTSYLWSGIFYCGFWFGFLCRGWGWVFLNGYASLFISVERMSTFPQKEQELNSVLSTLSADKRKRQTFLIIPLLWFPNNCIFKGRVPQSPKESTAKTRKTVSFPSLITSVELLMLEVQTKTGVEGSKIKFSISGMFTF